MVLYPKDIKEKIEYSKVIQYIHEECLSAMAIEYFSKINVSDDFVTIKRLLEETEEYKKSIERGEKIPISAFETVEKDIVLLRKEGYVLEVESIRNIYNLVHISQDVSKYFGDPEKIKLNPLLTEIVSGIIIDQKLTKEIDRTLDSEGEVRPDASPELMRIHKQIKSKEREVDKIFNAQLEVFRTQGFLVDTYESLRQGRRVLTVSADSKRKVSGIIHDESSTGKTLYIEPDAVVLLNQEIYNLYAERRHEIYKVLKQLCNFIRPYADTLVAIQHILTRIDVIRSKAMFAYRIGASKPILQQKPTFAFKEAFNPVLLLKNEKSGDLVVPFDLELHKNNRILILSGPNAGGKSVALKSVALLQMMIQSGILIPANENSVFGIFTKMFVDIGGQQSLEDDLSTYSSHLTNMKVTSDQADKNSLVLIDEFGSGTDPKIGGAIAEAILNTLNRNKVSSVITTHYSNLKYYAYKTPNIVNASMEFDKQKLSPTFKLIVGRPGSSFAFEIASKIGSDHEIIEYAKYKTGKNEKAIDEMLSALMAEKKEYEDKFSDILLKQDKLEKLISTYEVPLADLDIKKKKLKILAKEQNLSTISQQNQTIDKLLKDIKNTKNEEKAVTLAAELKKEQEIAVVQLKELKTEVYLKEISKPQEKPKIGSYVKMRNGDSQGIIVALHKDVAEVEMGILRLKVPIIDIVVTKEPIEIKKKSIHTEVYKDTKYNTTLDIREYTKSDALNMVQDFLDQALMNNAFELKIIHGIGTGVMRTEVLKLLKEYKDVKEVWHPEPEYGGKGVTYVKF